jgi:hypothetical protein
MTVSVLGAASYLGMQGLSSINSVKKQSTRGNSLQNTIYSVVNEIQSNVSIHKVSFDPSEFLKTTDPVKLRESLPLSWDDDVIIFRDQCPQCPGRLGYVIYPIGSDYKGLWKVTLRVTHDVMFKDSYQDYSFIISGM